MRMAALLVSIVGGACLAVAVVQILQGWVQVIVFAGLIMMLYGLDEDRPCRPR